MAAERLPMGRSDSKGEIMRGRAARLIGPLALVLAVSAVANSPEDPETVGSMTGMLDGEAREWFILRQDNDSHATFSDLGDMIVIDLVGFEDTEVGPVRDSLSLSITLVEGEVVGFDLLHPIGATSMPPAFTSENADVHMTLETFDVDGSQARVTGRVEGTLALQKSLDEAATLEEGVDISVDFDAQASRIEY